MTVGPVIHKSAIGAEIVEAIKTGAFGAFMPFDRQGQPLLFG